VSGEADLVFPELVRRVLDGASVAGLPGVRSRETIEEEFARGVFSNGPMVRDMDRLPLPDYRDYFEQFKASRYDRDWQPSVFLETSRGCWWGERMHCTFCGLNGESMTFRSKSPARAVAEITEMTRRYPGCDIQAIDNIIDFKYFKEVLPALEERRLKVNLFYETKSNLKKEHVRLLRRARVLKIQPGIESFSDAVLKLMRKGVTGLQNVQLLKWCKEYGVQPSWNFIWGFPGEPPEEYDRQSRLVPLLTHLPPPVAQAQIRLDRFSPNFFDAERLGFADVRPLPAYEHVYQLAPAAVANLASYFRYAYAEPRDVERYTSRLARELTTWKRVAQRSELLSVDAGTHDVLVDLRPAGRAPFIVLSGLARFLYRECDAVRDRSQLARAASDGGWTALTIDAIERTLAPLVEQGVIARDGARYLALAIPRGEYVPSAAANRQFARLLRELGSAHGETWIVPVDPVSNPLPNRTVRKIRPPKLATARFTVRGRELFIERGEEPNASKRRRHGKEEDEKEEAPWAAGEKSRAEAEA
jgi:ribosomal peptide maturation radical SAM protein 1